MQAPAPRLENDAIASALSTAPAARVSPLLAGLTLVHGCGPEFPAAKTTTIPAARRASRSRWNVSSQALTAGSPQEALTTSGASEAPATPLGASSHWNASWITLTVVLPLSS